MVGSAYENPLASVVIFLVRLQHKQSYDAGLLKKPVQYLFMEGVNEECFT